MKTRQEVQQRRFLRKLLIGSILLTALSVETLMVCAFSRDLLRPALQQQITIDPGLCFRGW